MAGRAGACGGVFVGGDGGGEARLDVSRRKLARAHTSSSSLLRRHLFVPLILPPFTSRIIVFCTGRRKLIKFCISQNSSSNYNITSLSLRMCIFQLPSAMAIR